MVSLHYKLTDSAGQLLDSSEGLDPLTYIHNRGGLLPALERELDGKDVGDRIIATIGCMNGYGEHHAELVQELDLAAFEGQPLSVGMRFNAKGKDGQSQPIKVVELHQNTVTIDANHPFAGKDLVFDVGIVHVRKSTASEIATGVVDPGEHQ